MAFDESLLSYSEFKQLAEDLSKKVNLFESIWMEDPNAEFFGGTSRDFGYWLMGQFRELKSRAEVVAKMKELRSFPLIDARVFIIGDSDVDLASNHSSFQKMADIFMIRRIDQVSADRFIEDTEAGQNELHQGYIPVEKIRLTRNGFIPWFSFKDGLKEIFDGKPSVHYSRPEEFEVTKYAKEGLNHPILLALRYLRILAVNYFQMEGQGYPDEKRIVDIDSSSERKTREIIDASLKDSRLRKLLQNPQFKKWMNASVVKAFRSYTNPTAAFYLYQYFKADLLVSKFSKYLEPLNQYLFAKQSMSDLEQQERLRKWGFNAAQIFVDIKKEFEDLRFIHGVKAGGSSLRSILREGILPSERGSAGRGLYGVSLENKKFSEDWAGSLDNVVEFPISSKAKMVDISNGAGEKLFKKFGKSEDEFCDYFGIQILKYPYPVPAFVVKDSSILGRAEPLYNKSMPVSEIFDHIDEVKSVEEALEIILRTEKIELTLLEHKLVMDLLIEWWIIPKLISIKSSSLLKALDFLSKIAPRYLNAKQQEEILRRFDLLSFSNQNYSDLNFEDLWNIFQHKYFSRLESKVFDISTSALGTKIGNLLKNLFNPREYSSFPVETQIAFLRNFKNKSMIPRLKERARAIKDWREIRNFIFYLVDFKISDIERREILDSIGIPWFHSGPL